MSVCLIFFINLIHIIITLKSDPDLLKVALTESVPELLTVALKVDLI